MNYKTFIANKLGNTQFNGIDAPLRDYSLFPHQFDLTGAALRRGRYVIAADTGLGKSRIQSAWADMVRREAKTDVLILAPLAVAEQTVEEAAAIGVEITHARDDSDIRPGVNITNYDRLHKFDCGRFGGIVLDESSIIKHVSSGMGRDLNYLIYKHFQRLPRVKACLDMPAWTRFCRAGFTPASRSPKLCGITKSRGRRTGWSAGRIHAVILEIGQVYSPTICCHAEL